MKSSLVFRNLNLLFSSLNWLKFLFNETLRVDLFDRFFLHSNVQMKLVVRLNITLPLDNALSKFKNKIYFILYFLVFKFLTGVYPKVVPVYKKINLNLSSNEKRSKRLQVLSSGFRGINFFVFFARLSKNNFYSFLTYLTLYVSRHTYLNRTVLSKYVKATITNKKNFLSGLLSFSASGLSLFEFFGNFNEVLSSKAKLYVNFNLKKNEFKNNLGILLYILQSLNLNVHNILMEINKSLFPVLICSTPALLCSNNK